MSYKSEAEKSLDLQYHWFMGVGTVYSIAVISLIIAGMMSPWVLVIAGIIWGQMIAFTMLRK